MGNCCGCCGSAKAPKGSTKNTIPLLDNAANESKAQVAPPTHQSIGQGPSTPTKLVSAILTHGVGSVTAGDTDLARSPVHSVFSEEFHDCRDDNFSVDGEELARHCALASCSPRNDKESSRLDSQPAGGHKQAGPKAAAQTPFGCDAVGEPFGASDTSEDATPANNANTKFSLSGCLTLLGSINLPGTHNKDDAGHLSKPRSTRAASEKPEAGSSVRRLMDLSPEGQAQARGMWGECDATTLMIRSVDYARTKQKINSQQAIYQLIGVDIFGFGQKQTHIAKMVHLPTPYPQKHLQTPETHLPPLLIVNIMLPLYTPPFFGGSNDGNGLSIVYYYALPENFDPSQMENQHALGLLRRFVSNGREADGTPTRDRLKLIPRIVNTEEWAARGPLSSAEYKLLVTYNDKPILTRPQQHFFHGHNYLEVDLDVHQYAFMARRALMSFLSRLKETVFENALVIQGNTPEELPEQILCATRLYRIDFEAQRPYADYLPQPHAAHPSPIPEATEDA